MLNIAQLRSLIIQPSLTAIGLYSIEAEQLLIGTALVESNLTFIAQTPNPIARSVWMIEATTYTDLRANIRKNEAMAQSALKFLNMTDFPLFYQYLEGNMYAACIFARLKYASIKEPLPAANDVKGMARYWGVYYNTKNLDADVLRFIQLYNKNASLPTLLQ